MIGLDTNVLVRYLVQDHVVQGKIAAEFIRKNCTREKPGFINFIVLCEMVWVLESVYRYKNDVIADVLEKILSTSQFEIESRNDAWVALEDYRNSKADFADCLIGRKNRSTGCTQTATFDGALEDMEGFLLL